MTIEVTANAFLHHMMRNIAGLLIAIGRGDQRPEWAGDILKGRDRTLKSSGVARSSHDTRSTCSVRSLS